MKKPTCSHQWDTHSNSTRCIKCGKKRPVDKLGRWKKE